MQKGYVGIFWRVRSEWITDKMPLSQAEPYGDALTRPISHADFWDSSQYRHLGEYTDYPRGRIVYFPKTETFIICRDARLAEAVKDAFKDWFLLNVKVEYKSDPHCRSLL